MGGFFYMMASKRHGTIYCGVTSDLIVRAWQHRGGVIPGFTKQYGVARLVYYEEFGDIREAMQRERTVKHWLRNWKIELIETTNPEWDDLWPSIARSEPG